MKHVIASLLLSPLLSIALWGCSNGDEPAPTLQEAAEQSQQAVEAEQAPVNYIRATPVPSGLTPERINSSPALGGPSLSGVQIAPSGEFVTVLQGREEDARQRDLWAYDLESGEGRLLVSSTDLLEGPEILSEEEKNRRERARQYGSGIISYSWVGTNLLLFPLGGDIYLYNLSTKKSRQVTATKGFETDPKVSGDGSKVAYVRDNELYIKDLKTGLERQLTDDSTETIRNATASFVVQEELGRSTGYWLSDNTKTVAYTQIDEAPVAIENRIDFSADGVKNIEQRYPFAGTDNATVKLGFISARGGKTRWVALDDDETRDHKTHRIYKINARSGEKTLFYEEASPTWLNIRSNFSPTKDGGLIWTAERNDKRQIFKIDADGAVNALTPESINARGLSCRTDNALFISGWKDSPLSNHIFKITQNGEGGQHIEQITSGPGIHSARFDWDCERYLGTYSDDKTPTNLRAYEADGI